MFKGIDEMQELFLGVKYADKLTIKYWIVAYLYKKQQLDSAELML